MCGCPPLNCTPRSNATTGGSRSSCRTWRWIRRLGDRIRAMLRLSLRGGRERRGRAGGSCRCTGGSCRCTGGREEFRMPQGIGRLQMPPPLGRPGKVPRQAGRRWEEDGYRRCGPPARPCASRRRGDGWGEGAHQMLHSRGAQIMARAAPAGQRRRPVVRNLGMGWREKGWMVRKGSV